MARRPRSSPPTAPAAYTSIPSRASSATLHAKLAGAPPKRGPSGNTSHNISPMPMTVARRAMERFPRSIYKLREHHHFTERQQNVPRVHYLVMYLRQSRRLDL